VRRYWGRKPRVSLNGQRTLGGENILEKARDDHANLSKKQLHGKKGSHTGGQRSPQGKSKKTPGALKKRDEKTGVGGYPRKGGKRVRNGLEHMRREKEPVEIYRNYGQKQTLQTLGGMGVRTACSGDTSVGDQQGDGAVIQDSTQRKGDRTEG